MTFEQKLIYVRPNADVDFYFNPVTAGYLWKKYGRNAPEPTLLAESMEYSGSTYIVTRTWKSFPDYLLFKQDPLMLDAILENDAYNSANGIVAQDITDMSQVG
jgi:hypothetical protein